jgi:hypothetical protein
MTRTTLKKNIHKAVDSINDDTLLQAVYTLLSRVSDDDYEWTKEDIRIAEERRASYLSGKAKMYTLAEVNKMIKKKSGK